MESPPSDLYSDVTPVGDPTDRTSNNDHLTEHIVIPILVPQLPEAIALIPYLKRIDSSRIYTNFGPLDREFRSRLGQLVNAPGVSLVSNGTTAIELALRSLNPVPGGICLMPSYTFVASAHAVANSGLEPYFLDVDEQSLMLTPEIVRNALERQPSKPAAVLVVSAFGAPLDIDGWDAFTTEMGIPVVFDGAAAIANINRVGLNPICVSLHATKTLGIGEGGAILTSNPELSDHITAMTGFGFTGAARVSQFRGGNYRISEYTAAVGLTALDQLSARISHLMSIAQIYHGALRGKQTVIQEGKGTSWISSTFNVRVPRSDVSGTIERLEKANIPWRRWWGHGCHTHPAFSSAKRDQLPVTEIVSEQIIGIPFHDFLTEIEVREVANCIA